MADPEEVVKINPAIRTITKREPGLTCQFCRRDEVNELEWGPLYQLKDIVVHYFCMLFSAALTQNGKDSEGILGFLPEDMLREMKRGERLKCQFCRKNGATVGCIIEKCKSSFHFSCGVEKGTLHHFTENFPSYCLRHKTQPEIPFKVPQEGVTCEVCQENVLLTDNYVWPPCCKLRLYHRTCIQEYARSAGYSFSCPSCKSTNEFIAAMKRSGVYIPDQDAAWERDPSFFREQLEVYSKCDAEECYCPDGRNHDASKQKPCNRNWKLVRCGACGASAVHYCCGQLKSMKWKCQICLDVITRATHGERHGKVCDTSSSSDTSSEESEADECVVVEYENVRHKIASQPNLPGTGQAGGTVRNITNVVSIPSVPKVDSPRKERKPRQRFIYDRTRRKYFRVEVPDDSDSDPGEYDTSMVSKSGVYKSSSRSRFDMVPSFLDKGVSENHRPMLNSFSESLRSLRSSCTNFQDWTKSRCRSSSLSREDIQSRLGHVVRRNETLVSSLRLSNLDLTEHRSKALEKAPLAEIRNTTVIAETKERHEPCSSISAFTNKSATITHIANISDTMTTGSPPKKPRMSDDPSDSLKSGSSKASLNCDHVLPVETGCESGNGSGENSAKNLIHDGTEWPTKCSKELPTLKTPSSSPSGSSIEVTDNDLTPTHQSEVAVAGCGTAASASNSSFRSSSQASDSKGHDESAPVDDIIEVIEVEPVRSKLIRARKLIDRLKLTFAKQKAEDDDLEIIHENLVDVSSEVRVVKSEALLDTIKRKKKKKLLLDTDCVTISDDDCDEIEITEVRIAETKVKSDPGHRQSDDDVIVLD